MSPFSADAAKPRASSRSREIDSFDLRAHEHEDRVELLGLEQARERVELVQAADQPVALADLERGGAARLDRDLARIAHVGLRDATDGVRQGRGEQSHLLVRRRLREQRFDRVGKPHLQHLVAFVEDEGLQLVELERAAVHVIEQAARRADDDVRAALEALQLRGVALAAVDRQHVEAGNLRRVFLESLGDLDRELAGRAEHQRLRRRDRRVDAARGSAARTRPSCRCRSMPGRAGPRPRATAGWSAPGWASGFVADLHESGDDGRTQTKLGEARRGDLFGHGRGSGGGARNVRGKTSKGTRFVTFPPEMAIPSVPGRWLAICRHCRLLPSPDPSFRPRSGGSWGSSRAADIRTVCRNPSSWRSAARFPRACRR